MANKYQQLSIRIIIY